MHLWHARELVKLKRRVVANATNAAGEQLVPTALQEKHGRWAPGSKARAGYVEDSEEAKAIVPGLLKL